jgi:hypothetical protein
MRTSATWLTSGAQPLIILRQAADTPNANYLIDLLHPRRSGRGWFWRSAGRHLGGGGGGAGGLVLIRERLTHLPI